MKILTVIGARPQFIKAAALSHEINKHDDVQEVLVHTGQHFDENMSDIFFNEMKIPKPAYNLDINSMGHGAMTGRMIESIEKILLEEKPDYVNVYGDTNSTLAAALAATKLHIPIIHIEAGLRSFNNKMPEEINRILTDRISRFLFCPSDNAIENLKTEGFDNYECDYLNVGDIMYDAALLFGEQSKKVSKIDTELELSNKEYVLATIHRAENTDHPERLKSIISALNTINEKLKVVVPLHPRTKAILDKNDIKVEFSIVDPVGYFDMLKLIEGAKVIATDSGGLQKEAYFYDVPCITMRDETEWVELVSNGVNQICAADEKKIIDAFNTYLEKDINFPKGIYGDGKASEKIINTLKKA